MTIKKRYAAIGLAGVIFAALLLFNDSFRLTLSRYQEIRRMKTEVIHIDSEIFNLKHKISRLQNNPSMHEQLVRQELGYLRPGEKEIRFLKTPPKKDN